MPNGPGISGTATHTPDGRPITFNGPPCDHCGNRFSKRAKANGQPNLFVRCSGEMIIGKVVHALNKTYHPEHFVCANCSQPFPGGKFIDHEGKPYCEQHYWELYAPRCYACQQPVREGVIKYVRGAPQLTPPNSSRCGGGGNCW